MTELRSDALRLLAHDMNNPLTAIRILSEMLRDRARDEEIRRDATDILESADFAAALVEGMSSLAMLEQKEEEEEYTWFPIDIVQILRHVVNRPALRRHVQLSLPRELPLIGDRSSMLRALTDVFVNARKLLDSRQQVGAWAQERDGMVELRVHHPGEPIAPGLRERMLEMYGAVELRHNRLPVSAGGLVYARSTIEAHGGTMVFVDAAHPRSGAEGMDLVIQLPR